MTCGSSIQAAAIRAERIAELKLKLQEAKADLIKKSNANDQFGSQTSNIVLGSSSGVTKLDDVSFLLDAIERSLNGLNGTKSESLARKMLDKVQKLDVLQEQLAISARISKLAIKHADMMEGTGHVEVRRRKTVARIISTFTRTLSRSGSSKVSVTVDEL